MALLASQRCCGKGPMTGVLEWKVFLPGKVKTGTRDTDSGIKNALSKFAITKLCGTVNTRQGRDAIQRDLHRLDRWAPVTFRRFNKAKYKVLHMGQGKPKHKFNLGGEWIENSLKKKDFGILVNENKNHRTVWVGKVFKDYLVPTPLLWAGTPTKPGCSEPHPTLTP
ncbi:rna-directed dna polymerase from mobile element jockey-like [Pitangus sulphuratus]|nr:rna-directed dna polymerase from mobile element jockey-like [Pitangus sulphuratus]